MINEIEKKLEEVGLKVPNVLLPNKKINYSKFSCIAADQFTQDISYWEKVKEYVGESPSTLNLIYPEAELEKILDDKENFDKILSERIKVVNDNMEKYLQDKIYEDIGKCFVYVERKIDSVVRKGLVVAIDLEKYDYNEGAKTLMRATEKTVVERLKVRKRIRKNASIDMPHIMVLIDDKSDSLFSTIKNMNLKNDSENKVYDFELMFGSGHLTGYKISNEKYVDSIADVLLRLKNNSKDNLLYAVGDGNHSLAAAKDVYTEIGRGRYALVELVNLYDEGLKFYPIHRLVYGINKNEFKKETGVDPDSPIPLQDMQKILDEKGYKIDYIHGKEECLKLAENGNNTAIIYDKFSTDTLFDDVINHGSLCRKSFSMGNAKDKRFYLEAQKIV